MQHEGQIPWPGEETKMSPAPKFMPLYEKGESKLAGKVALITGGDSGIGRAVAVLYAREGADVAISYFNEEMDAKITSDLVEAEGRKCLLLPGDISSESFCRELVERTVSHFGKLNIVVNNAAAHFPVDQFEEMSMESMRNTFAINVFSQFYITQAALPHLKEGDSIINTSSVVAYRGSEKIIDYSATKGAIVSFTRSLSMLLAPKKIRVNGVAPGPIWTPLIPASYEDKTIKTHGGETPLGRTGHPNEVAPAYLWLASAEGSYISGQFIHINGGEVVNG